MDDTENFLQPSKKRAAGRQLSRENPGLDDEEETSEQESGTFKKASDDVLASRRIVKVRRHQPSSAPSSNPFAGIRLVPNTVATATPSEVVSEAESKKADSEDVVGKKDVDKEAEKEKHETSMQSEEKIDEAEAESTGDEEKVNSVNEATKAEAADEKVMEGDKTENVDNKVAEGEKTEKEDKKDDGIEIAEKAEDAASLSSFQQLSSSQNAFTGLAGTGFSNSTFSFGPISKDGPQLGFSSGSLSGEKTAQPFSSFGFGLSSNGSSSLFGTSGASVGMKSEGSGFVAMQEVPVETGEENEKAAFTADSVLFEYLDGGWKERGKGELRVNVATTGQAKARLVMRARGNYRLILNASLYIDMKLANMEKRGVTFACVNSIGEGKDSLSTFALKFKDASIVEEFRAIVTEHKAKTAEVLKTPENSPKASDE